MSDKKWKWAVSVNIDKEKCAATCGETLRAYKSTLVEYRGRTWHVHCLLDHLAEKDPPEEPVGLPNIWGGWGVGGGVSP